MRALLAALALRPARPVPVPALIDDVWADDPPQDAPAALQALVGRLRRALGRDGRRVRPGRIPPGRAAATRSTCTRSRSAAAEGAAQLAAGDPESAARTLRAALALWRGPALADLPERDAAARPEAQRLAALRNRIEADLRRGATDALLARTDGTARLAPVRRDAARPADPYAAGRGPPGGRPRRLREGPPHPGRLPRRRPGPRTDRAARRVAGATQRARLPGPGPAEPPGQHSAPG